MDGRFRVVLYDSLLHGSLLVEEPELGCRFVEVGAVDAALGEDLGDIILEPAQGLVFRVLDDAAAPIEGAWALAPGAPIQGTPTNPDGMGALSVLPLGQEQLEFSALGFRTRTVQVPRDRTEVFEVVLDPVSRLSIRVRTPDSMFVPGVWVVLSFETDTAFDANAPDRPDERQVDLGASVPRHIKTSSAVTGQTGRIDIAYETDARGEVLVTGLRPGVTCAARVEDVSGRLIAPEQSVTIQGRRDQTLPFTVEGEPAWCQVLVTDEKGEALEGASVKIEVGRSGYGTRDHTDQEGIAWVGNLFGENVGLVVSRSGFVSARVEAALTPVRPSRVEVSLAPGRDVRLTVSGQDGSEVDADRVEALLDGAPVGGTMPLGSGEYGFYDLPEAPLVLRARVAGQWFERPYDAFGELATIHVPPFGSLNVEWTGTSFGAEDRCAVVIERLDGDGEEVRRYASSAEIDAGVRFPVVFPGEYRVQLGNVLLDGEFRTRSSRTVRVHPDQECTVALAP
jgi:hypothetical protein